MNLSVSKDFSFPNLILNWPVILVMHLAFVLDQDLITYTAYKEEMEFVILEPRLLKSVTSFAMIDWYRAGYYNNLRPANKHAAKKTRIHHQTASHFEWFCDTPVSQVSRKVFNQIATIVWTPIQTRPFLTEIRMIFVFIFLLKNIDYWY